MGTTQESYDVFISFAGPDRARAETLHDLLEKRGFEVFLAERDIALGDFWDSAIPQSLRRSRSVAVLLSERTADAHFQREEIQFAIQLQRQGQLTLIPIFLQGASGEAADWEFGLRRFHGIDMQAQGPEKVAGLLGARLDEPETTAEKGPEAPRTYGEWFHDAVRKLDRTQQWSPILEVCGGTENALFLVHGPKLQNLELFVSRIWHYLAYECQRHHRPFDIPLKDQFAVPRSVSAWENHLRLGLVNGLESDRGTAEELLCEAARSHPVFLVLSRPVGPKDLDDLEATALEEFVGRRLPELMARASAGGHPFRALIATHYEAEGESLVRRLDGRAHQGCQDHGIRYDKLPPLRPLEWSDVEYFLDKKNPRPPAQVYEKLKAMFHSLDRGSMPFREIVEKLGSVLY